MRNALDPLSAIVRLPTAQETQLARKCLPMRLPISPHRLNLLKKSGLKPHDYEFHIPGTRCVTRLASLAGPGKPVPAPPPGRA
jgi:hypothetical protein